VNDQHITAVATIVQDLLLLASAFLIAWYLYETRKMRKAAQEQVKESQALVVAAQKQLDAGHEQVQASQRQVTATYEQLAAIREQTAVAQDQLEGQIRPALVARFSRDGVELVNIGKGPALHVKLGPVKPGSHAYVKPPQFGQLPDPIGFMEPRQVCQTRVQVKSGANYPGAPDLDGSSLQCTYKSLSGRTHYTVVDFAGTNVTDTRFYDYSEIEDA
jgi:hypothetical protein